MSAKKWSTSLTVMVSLVLVIVACSPTPTSTPTPSPTSTPTILPTEIPTNTITPTHTPVPTLTETSTPTCPPDSSKYGFELPDTPWISQTYMDSQAVIAVTQSEKYVAKFGCYSLQLSVDLVGGHENKSKGEAFVDMRFYPPPGIEAPLNLEGVPIIVWLYVPELAAGDPSRPNGIQVFVKDEDWRAEYGPWFALPGYTDKWIPIRMTPSREMPPSGFMDPGFDPTKVIMLGVKIGAGAGTAATFSGPVYVDGISW